MITEEKEFNIEELGLVPQDINWPVFNTLTEIGKFVYCTEAAKAKNRADYKIVCMSEDGTLRNIYWVTNNTKASVPFIERSSETKVVDVLKMQNTPKSHAGLGGAQ